MMCSKTIGMLVGLLCFHNCAEIYHYFKLKLKKFFYYPVTAPALSKFRLVDMFTSITEDEVKKNIIANFTALDGLCRVVIGTIGFGMGLDSPNVRTLGSFHRH